MSRRSLSRKSEIPEEYESISKRLADAIQAHSEVARLRELAKHISNRNEGQGIQERVWLAQTAAEEATDRLVKTIKMMDTVSVRSLRTPVVRFATAMETNLRSNDHKGGWRECDRQYLLKKLEEEVSELKKELVKPNNLSRIRDESADVGNIAMMIWDNSMAAEEGESRNTKWKKSVGEIDQEKREERLKSEQKRGRISALEFKKP